VAEPAIREEIAAARGSEVETDPQAMARAWQMMRDVVATGRKRAGSDDAEDEDAA
jgi:hypothetical protein